MKSKLNNVNKMIQTRYESIFEVARSDFWNMHENHRMYESVVRPVTIISESFEEVKDLVNNKLSRGATKDEAINNPKVVALIDEAKSLWANISEEDFLYWTTEYRDWDKDLVKSAMAA